MFLWQQPSDGFITTTGINMIIIER